MVRAWWQEERGASTLLLIILGFLLVLGAAVLFNFALLGYVRHRAVTGADAAALAGAEEIARYLSTTWELCAPAGTPPAEIVREYDMARPQAAVWSQMGFAQASAYAAANGSRLAHYRVRWGAETWNVQGYPLRQILVDASVRRPYELAGPVVGGQRGEMGAEATAEVYLSRYEFQSWDCSPNPDTPMVYYWFRFTWRIRLVR
jgi:hypothetical protein